MGLRRFQFNDKEIALGAKTYIMGILNVTPDSFSDGGRYLGVDAATRQAAVLIESGADFIDLGAESTRPGYQPVTTEEEWQRLGPVLKALRQIFPEIALSVDTQKAETAHRAVQSGADIINDVGGDLGDPRMLATLSSTRAGYVMMYNREPRAPANMADMVSQFQRRLREAHEFGIAESRILVDPGLGFAYGLEDNWRVLGQLEQLKGLGAGMLVGPSRKRFLGTLTGAGPDQRDFATASLASLAVGSGMDVVRVHEVAGVRQALLVADRWWRHG